MDVGVILCTHNPRRDYLQRVLEALKAQTLPRDQWELLVVDNASDERLADTCDLSWHVQSRHVREDRLGLTQARLRGITDARGELLVFVDDDNVLAPDFLLEAWALHRRYPHLGAFGAGTLEPEFEVTPPPEIRPLVSMLAVRSVQKPRWSNNPRDADSIPWGAGLCVSRRVADLYLPFVARLESRAVLDRLGPNLFSGGDDLFSWVAASAGCGFGVFPELRLVHLIGAGRLSRPYFLKLIHDHAFSNRVLHYVLADVRPRRLDAFRYVHLLLHGIRNGLFAMRCQWAESRGEHDAAQFVASAHLRATEPGGVDP